jgi:hypothetical protein
MKSSLLGLLAGVALVLALATAPAQAKNCGSHTVAPPGNSGVNQYVEHVPTACGDKPTNKVGGGAGGAGGSGGPGSGGAIPASTASLLAKLGAAGRGAAAFAQATAPGHAGRNGGTPSNGAGSSSVSGASTGAGSSPITSLVKALTGSSSGGGLGTFLPILLIASAIGLGGIALLRRRRAT